MITLSHNQGAVALKQTSTIQLEKTAHSLSVILLNQLTTTATKATIDVIMRPAQVEIKLRMSCRQTAEQRCFSWVSSIAWSVQRDISPEVVGSCRSRRNRTVSPRKRLVSTCSRNTVRLCRPLQSVRWWEDHYRRSFSCSPCAHCAGGSALQTKCQARDSRVASGICCVLHQPSTRRTGEKISPARYFKKKRKKKVEVTIGYLTLHTYLVCLYN